MSLHEDRFQYEDSRHIDGWTRDRAERAIEKFDMARDEFEQTIRDAARKFGLATFNANPAFIDCVDRKNRSVPLDPSEAIQGFVETMEACASDNLPELLNHDAIDRARMNAEGRDD